MKPMTLETRSKITQRSPRVRNRLAPVLMALLTITTLGALAPWEPAKADPVLRTDCPAYPGGIGTDTSTSGNWVDSYGTCSYILPGYTVPWENIQTPVLVDYIGPPVNGGNYGGGISLADADCTKLIVNGQSVSYRVRRCDINLPSFFNGVPFKDLPVAGGGTLGDAAMAWRWNQAVGIPTAALVSDGICPGPVAAAFDDAAEVDTNEPASGVCIDLNLPTLPGTWRLSSYELDYDALNRVVDLGLYPYQNTSGSPIGPVKVDNFQAGKYVSWVLNGLQPLTVKVIADRVTTQTLNSVISGLFLDQLGSASCSVLPNCNGCLCVNANPVLEIAGKCTIFELGTGNVRMSNANTTGDFGNLCMAGGSVRMTGGQIVTGDAYLATGVKPPPQSRVGGTIYENFNLSPWVATAMNVYNANLALSCDQTIPKVPNVTGFTITAQKPGLNVICVNDIIINRPIYLSNGAITDPVSFIVKVTGSMMLSGGHPGQIRVAGTVQPRDVLFNVIGTGPDVRVTGGGGGSMATIRGIIDGTILAPYRNIMLNPGLVNGQVMSSMDITLMSGAFTNCPPCTAKARLAAQDRKSVV